MGVVLATVAQDKGVDLNSELVTRAEDILINELCDEGFKKTALNFIPLILAALEVK